MYVVNGSDGRCIVAVRLIGGVRYLEWPLRGFYCILVYNIICTMWEELENEVRFSKVNSSVHCSLCSQLNNILDHLGYPFKTIYRSLSSGCLKPMYTYAHSTQACIIICVGTAYCLIHVHLH